MGEPGGLPSIGLHRVGHDWSDLTAAAAEFQNAVKLVMAYVNETVFKNFFESFPIKRI